MTDELQPLIDRIQREAVQEAEQKADELIAKAREEAAQITREAEQKAQQKLAEAEKEAEIFTARSTKALEQAARDLLLTVGKGVEDILSQVVAEDVKEAMTPEVLAEMLVHLSEACTHEAGEETIEVLLSPEDQQKMIDYFSKRYHEKMAKGMELKADNEIFKGFKISFVNESVYHEFTYEAIAESISHFLRPHLAKIVRRVAQARPESIGGSGVSKKE